MADITDKNYPRFKKLYLKALEEGDDSFMFYDQEVLVSYAKYFCEYVENRRGNS